MLRHKHSLFIWRLEYHNIWPLDLAVYGVPLPEKILGFQRIMSLMWILGDSRLRLGILVFAENEPQLANDDKQGATREEKRINV